MKKLCVIRLSALGDVVLTTGVLNYWFKTKGLQFVVITSQSFASLFKGNPAVADIVPLSDKERRSWFKTSKKLSKQFHKYPLLDLHRNLRSKVLSYFWPQPVHRYAKLSIVRRFHRLLPTNWTRKKLVSANVPQRYLSALDNTPPPHPFDIAPRVFLDQREIQKAKKQLAQLGITSDFAVLHPYATHPSKAWPREYWLECTQRLTQASIPWIIIGKGSEPILLESPFDLTNKTGLRQTCALISQGSVLLTNDSGPMHLGTAVKTPVLGLFGPTSKEWGFYPSGKNDRVLSLELPCSPCSLHGKDTCTKGNICLVDLHPKQVFKELRFFFPS